jgi:Dolichyl-phosphate-mannose-protein mannosyltransferase
VIGSRRLSSTSLWTFGLVIAYLATRLAALTVLPIFFDETGHIRWAIWISQGQKIEKPWQYGKGLQIFAGALLFPWAHEHYLWASRALAVLFGAGTLAGAILLGRALGGARVGWLAGIFYIACPYALVYDRLALTDPAMATFAILVAVLCLRLVEHWRVRDGLLVGLALALAVFAKALGVLLFFAPAAAVLLIAPARLRRPLPLIAAYAVGCGLTAYPLLRYFQVTATVRVAVSKSDASLLVRLAQNLPLCASWLWTYWTPVFIALALLAIVRSAFLRARKVAFVALFILLPVIAFAGVGDIWFPRYLVFLTAPFAALAAWGADGLAAAIERRRPEQARMLTAAGLVLALLPAARADWPLLVDPPRAPLVELDRFQYVTGWPSGYGVRDTVDFVRSERARHPEGITVVTHARTVRTTARALDLEFAYARDVRVEDLNFDHPDGALPLLAEWARERPTLVVLEPPQGKSRRPDPATFGLDAVLAAQTFKPDGKLCDEVYRLCGGERCPPRP